MEDNEKAGDLQDKIDVVMLGFRSKIKYCNGCLRCPPSNSSVNIYPEEKRRVAFVDYYFRRPDILLLDEPTNHLIKSVLWLEQHLQQYKRTVINL